MRYFDDLRLQQVARVVTSRNNVRPSGHFDRKIQVLGFMVRGEVILVTEEKSIPMKAPFIYWSNISSSRSLRGYWQSLRGSERENCWIVGEGDRFARMIESIAELFDHKNYHPIAPEDMIKLYQIFNRLYEAFMRLDVLEKYRLPVLMEELAAAVAQIGENRKKELSSKMSNLVLQTARKMQNDPGKIFDIERIAGESRVSKDYFRHAFQQYIGTSFHEYLLSQRYNMAVRLLRETDLAVGTVSDMCGFSAQRLFTQFFKKRSGFSPKAFREHTF